MSSQSFSQFITLNLQDNGIKITKQCSDVNCVKSVRIQGWSEVCQIVGLFLLNNLVNKFDKNSVGL